MPALLEMANDADLVRRAQTGDGAAWNDLFRRHESALRRLAGAIVRHEEDARDICQEAYRQALASLADCDTLDRFDLWMKRIVVNRSRDLLRRRKVRMADPADLIRMPEPPANPEAILSGREEAGRVRKAIDELPAEFREILILHLLEEMSYRDLAAMLEITVNAVRIRIHRGLALVRERVKENVR